MTSDMRMFAVIVSPAKGPAPTLLTNRRPAMTANAPTRPPKGAHHGIALRPAAVGKGRGKHITKTASTATIGRNDTKLASHGFCSELRSAPFIGGPQAWSVPAIRIAG